MSKVFLVLPPNYCYTYDFFPLGTAMLCAFLKQKNVDTEQADYNLKYLNYWTKKIFPDSALINLPTAEAAGLTQNILNAIFAQKAKKNYYFSSFFPADEEFTPYEDLGNSSFSFTEQLIASSLFFRYLEDSQENTFLDFYKTQGILKTLTDKKISVLGISIIAPSQAIAALTLGYWVKKNLTDVFVVIGGQWPSLFRKQLTDISRLTQCFDGLIYFEGETPLYELVQALKAGNNLSRVPNLIYACDNEFIHSNVCSKENLDLLPAPDFTGISFNDYCTTQARGKTALVYQTARECYWNRCAYCVDLPLPKQGYRQRSLFKVIEDIEFLIHRWGMSFLEISNATLSPRQMREISQEIIKRNLNFSWRAFARLDPGFTHDVLDLAKHAGCENLMFGLESASQRVLDTLSKGIKIDTAKQILCACHKTKIDVSLQMMIGLPSETRDDVLKTIDFLIKNRELINQVTFNIYYLTPACQVFLNPKKYGLHWIKPKSNFKFFQQFTRLDNGLTRTQAREFLALYDNLMKKKKPNPDLDKEQTVNDWQSYLITAAIGQEKAFLWYDYNPLCQNGRLREYSNEAAHV